MAVVSTLTFYNLILNCFDNLYPAMQCLIYIFHFSMAVVSTQTFFNFHIELFWWLVSCYAKCLFLFQLPVGKYNLLSIISYWNIVDNFCSAMQNDFFPFQLGRCKYTSFMYKLNMTNCVVLYNVFLFNFSRSAMVSTFSFLMYNSVCILCFSSYHVFYI